jgi:hypothetical protein
MIMNGEYKRKWKEMILNFFEDTTLVFVWSD